MLSQLREAYHQTIHWDLKNHKIEGVAFNQTQMMLHWHNFWHPPKTSDINNIAESDNATAELSNPCCCCDRMLFSNLDCGDAVTSFWV